MNTSKRIGIYAGSFDPITKGHIWVIEQGLQMFDFLYVAIGVNPSKNGYFTPTQRLDMIDEYLRRNGFDSLARVITFENRFLVHVAKELGAQTILRGIRNAKDFEYEIEIKNFNDNLVPEIQTVFVVPPPKLVGTSSSIIRGSVGLDGWEQAIQEHTTEYVTTQFKKRLSQAG